MKNEEEGRKRHSSGAKARSKKAKKRERQAAEEFEEERRLTALLFGGGDAEEVVDSEQVSFSNHQYEKDDREGENHSLFQIDRIGGSGELEHDDSGTTAEDIGTAQMAASGSKAKLLTVATSSSDSPVWKDDDDEDVTVSLLETSRLRKLRKSRYEDGATSLSGAELESRLRQRYQSTMQMSARIDWAQIDETPQDDRDETKRAEQDELDFFDSAEPLLVGTQSGRLPPNILNTIRCPDANQSDPNQAVVQAVHFHPGSDPDHPLLLTAGFDKTLRFFQVGSDKSDKIHGIHCK